MLQPLVDIRRTAFFLSFFKALGLVMKFYWFYFEVHALICKTKNHLKRKESINSKSVLQADRKSCIVVKIQRVVLLFLSAGLTVEHFPVQRNISFALGVDFVVRAMASVVSVLMYSIVPTVYVYEGIQSVDHHFKIQLRMLKVFSLLRNKNQIGPNL